MVTRSPRRTSRNGDIATAIAVLLNNEAAMLAEQTRFMHEMAEMRKDFAKICKELEAIKAVLIRHETLLQNLPEALRDKIGFKQ